MKRHMDCVWYRGLAQDFFDIQVVVTLYIIVFPKMQ